MRPVFFFPAPVTVLDCGTTRATLAVLARRRGARPELLHYSSVALATEGGSETGWLEKTVQALPSLTAATGVRGPVTVILPPHLILMKMLQTPPVAPGKRDKIIQFECKQGIPYPLAEVAWDRTVTMESALGCHVLLCAAKLEALEPLCAAVSAMGLQPVQLVPAVHALVTGYRALAGTPQAGLELFVDLGSRHATIVLFEGGGWQARSVSQAAIGMEEGKEESLVAKRLAQEIIRTLVHFGRPVGVEPAPRIVLNGEEGRLSGLASALGGGLTLPTGCWTAEGGRLTEPETGPVPAWVELVGAAGLAQTRPGESMNLLPPRLRQQAGRRILRPWVAVTAGLAVAWLTGSWQWELQRIAAGREQNVMLENSLVGQRREARRVEAIRQRREERDRRSEAVATLIRARGAWSGLLAELEKEFPTDGSAWLERLEPAPGGGGAKPAPVVLELTVVLETAVADEAGEQGSAALRRANALLERLTKLSVVVAVRDVRCEPAAHSRLRCHFVLELREGRL